VGTPGVATVGATRAVPIIVVPRRALLSMIRLEHPVNALARKLSAAVMMAKTASVVTNPGRE
jgi:hypothetical protein